MDPEHSRSADTLELQEWEFTFQRIEVDDYDGETTFVDDWEAR